MTATEFVVPQLWPQQIEQGLASLPRLFGQTPIPQSRVWRLDCDRYLPNQFSKRKTAVSRIAPRR